MIFRSAFMTNRSAQDCDAIASACRAVSSHLALRRPTRSYASTMFLTCHAYTRSARFATGAEAGLLHAGAVAPRVMTSDPGLAGGAPGAAAADASAHDPASNAVHEARHRFAVRMKILPF